MTNSAQESKLSTGPLKGVRVLDLSRILAGPTCTQLLGDLGADIIKIERPVVGDDTRSWGPPFVKGKDGQDTRESAYYLCANRNKRSVAVDMAKPAGATLIRQLAKSCDIMIENFKVGGLEKYGLDFKAMNEEFPDLVYCSITGFGQTGPNASKPGYDLMAQGYGGIMSLTGEPDGAPMKVAVGIADVVCGLYASTAILAALRHRDLGNGGQHIDLALVDSQVAWLVNAGTNYLTDGKSPGRLGNQHSNIVPYQVFQALDGHVILAVGNDSQYRRFCEMIDRVDLAEDERFATNQMRLENRSVLIPQLTEIIAGWKKQEFLKGLDEKGVPAGPVNTLPEVFATGQVSARNMKITMSHPTAATGQVNLIGNPVKMSKTPVNYDRPPPVLGQHTHEVLLELLGRDGLDLAIKNNAIE